MDFRIQTRTDTANNFTLNNPTLLLGEPALESDTKREKIGDGVTAWNSLGYKNLSQLIVNGAIDFDYGSDLTMASTSHNTALNITQCNQITIHTESGSVSVSSLLNFPNHPIVFKCSPTDTFTFTVTPFADIAQANVIMGDTNIVLVGARADEVVLKKVVITNVNGTFSVIKRV